MKLSDLQNKKIGIFGYGTEGKALLDYLYLHKVKDISVFDEKNPTEEYLKRIKEHEAKFIGGPFDKKNHIDIEVAFRSPGLSLASIRELLPENAAISSLTNLFFANCKGKTIGVTGTKGKSTTVNLVGELLKQNNIKHFIGGNIGNPPLNFLDETAENSYSVLELSSFQTEDLQFSPDIAIILPISSDHLDFHSNQGEHFNFHASLEQYLKSKGQLLAKMKKDSLALLYDSKNVRKIAEHSQAKKIYFSETESEDIGCFFSNATVECVVDEREAEFEDIERLSQEKKVPMVNILAVISFGFVLNYKVDIQSILSSFKKLPLRIELVGEDKGVKYYNDSAATNPVSTIAAMKTMTGKYALICGGSSKGLSFEVLAHKASTDPRLLKIFLFGQTSGEIESELKKAGFQKSIVLKGNLNQVMEEIHGSDGEFGAVLFSPASASFDQYKNYIERGKHFTELVQKISTKA